MNLRQINELWNEYKEKYDLPKDVQISAVQYDAEKYVEGFFNILELLDGKYILHLNPRFHLYSDSYARFILFHEFTHFYDFINSSFDETEDLFISCLPCYTGTFYGAPYPKNCTYRQDSDSRAI